MVELTVGYVAGIVALGIVIAQIWLPTALSFVLAGVLRNDESASTWSIAGRILQSSYWPTVLRSDSSRSHAVRKPVLFIGLAIPAVTILIAIVGVVTPLGLYEVLESHGEIAADFQYVRESSAYFDGTSPRGPASAQLSRFCIFRGDRGPCPYANNTFVIGRNGTTGWRHFTPGLTTEIAPILREIFSSGTQNISTTVSNYFDIQYRQLTTQTNSVFDNGSRYPVGMFRHLDSIVLWDSITAIEGLVVDAKSGGVGFRNHTLPVDLQAGREAKWHEDLLFVEPVTTCVDTNVTIDYTVSSESFNDTAGDYRLTDRGGFVNLNHTYPYYDLSNPQANPDLWGRAYKAAVINNFGTMNFLNVTNQGNDTLGIRAYQYLNSSLGKTFPLSPKVQDSRGIDITSYGSFLFTNGVEYPNPFNITQNGLFSDARLVCSGAGGADYANISNIYVACGLMKGAPQRVGDGPKAIFEHASQWSQSLYSCATAIRATIKTVHFSVNGTKNIDLDSLRVDSIVDKEYPDPSHYPVWGFEDTGKQLHEIEPLWGLVLPDYEGFPNVSTVRQPSFYLPGWTGDGLYTLEPGKSATVLDQNLPGSDFPRVVANTVYAIGGDGISEADWPLDLVGRASMAIFTRWQNLSSSAATVGTIVDLLWTDLAASAVVGAKGVLGPGNAGSPGTDSAASASPAITHVIPSVRRIKYRVAFGIPAFVLLLVIIVASCLAALTWATERSSIAVLKLRMQQLSVGRVFTTVLYPDESNFTMSPGEWSTLSGAKAVSLIAAPEPGRGQARVEDGGVSEVTHLRVIESEGGEKKPG